MDLEVQHTTHFTYPEPVHDSFNETRLQPISNHQQERVSFSLEVTPGVRPGEYRDFYQNVVHYFEVTPPHSELKVTARSRVRTGGIGTGQKTSVGSEPLHDYLQASPFVSLPVEIFREAVDHQGIGPTDEERAVSLMEHVNGSFVYEPNVTQVHTHVEEVFRLRRGVCQDFAHAMISLCRLVKIPARYVSGYVYCGDRGEMRGAEASHAWVEVHVGEAGWVGLDPTNRCRVGEMHIKVAHGRDYRDVPPLSGNYHGDVQGALAVTVAVRKI
jgi:transglutaminase-like putative cysteine protease